MIIVITSFIFIQLFVYGGDFDTKDGTGCRDYIHIMDIARGHVAALKQIVDPTFHGVKIYNLGTGKGVTVLEIVKTFERVTGECYRTLILPSI